jgi:hypothetical protein
LVLIGKMDILPACLASGTSFKAEWYAYDIGPSLAFLFRITHVDSLTGMLGERDKLLMHCHSPGRSCMFSNSATYSSSTLFHKKRDETMYQNEIDDDQASLISSQSKKPTPDTLTSMSYPLLLPVTPFKTLYRTCEASQGVNNGAASGRSRRTEHQRSYQQNYHTQRYICFL